MAGFTLDEIVQAASSFPDGFDVISGDKYIFETRRFLDGGEALVVFIGHWGARAANAVNRLWAGCDNDKVYYYFGNSPTVTAVDQQPFPSSGRRKCRFEEVEVFNLLEPPAWPYHQSRNGSFTQAREIARSHLGLLVKFAFLQYGAIENISGKTDGGLIQELRDMCASLLHHKVARELAARLQADHVKEEVAAHENDDDREGNAFVKHEEYEAAMSDVEEHYDHEDNHDHDRFYELHSQALDAWRQLKSELEQERELRRQAEKRCQDTESKLLMRDRALQISASTAHQAKKKYAQLKKRYKRSGRHTSDAWEMDEAHRE